LAEFDKLFDELQRRSSMDKSALLKLIEEKKRKVGAGYLTDMGALFLVASDLGITLDYVTTSDLTLKDLYIGANEITIISRVLSAYPIQNYTKKDGSKGYYRRIILFDKDNFVNTTLWDEKTTLIDPLNINPNMVVKIIKGYVRAGLDGRPVLHLGSRGSVEVLDDQELAKKLPTIEEMTKDVSAVKSPASHLSIRGSVKTEPKLSQFTRKDGSQGSVIQFYINDIESDQAVRVAIWDSESKAIESLQIGFIVRLINVKAKMLSYGEIELHGDVGTALEIVSKKIVRKASPMTFRLLSIGPTQEGKSASALLIDSVKRFYTLMAKDDARNKLSYIKPDSLITCYPREVINSKIICEDEKSIVAKTLDDSIYPKLQSLTLKIKDASNLDHPVFLEVMALSNVSIKDVTTKDSSIIKKAEIMVGDETGERKLVAWRDLTTLLEGISPGEKLRINAVIPQAGVNEHIFIIRPYSSIEKITV
jgi:replication factor A1